MKKTLTIIVSAFFLFSFSWAQDIEPSGKSLIPVVQLAPDVTIKFGGFVRADYYVDSREIVGAIDDLFGFFPENKRLDADGKDLNEVLRHNLSTQTTRFSALLSGVNIFNAKSNAYFEFDFSGGNAVNVRLRHAWLKLTWERSELLLGKTWNPLADIPFPNVGGLHTGVPFRPFGRGDQVRFTYKATPNFHVLVAGLYQSEHKNFLDERAAGDTRANPVPDFHLQLHYRTSDLFAGIASEYKVIKPATETQGTGGIYKTNRTLPSFAFSGFADYRKNLFNIKASALYGQNLSELFQQGGYAVKSYDAETGSRTYSPSNFTSCWLNVNYGKKWVVGIFGGYQKNLGFNDNILSPEEGGAFFGRWQDIDHLYRIAPSLKYAVGQWVFHAELDFNVASYGTVDYMDKGKVKDGKEILGIRGLFATSFFF